MPKFEVDDVVTTGGRHTPSPDIKILAILNDGSNGERVQYGCRYYIDDGQRFYMYFDDDGGDWVVNKHPFHPRFIRAPYMATKPTPEQAERFSREIKELSEGLIQ